MSVFPASIFSPRAKANRNGVVYDANKATVTYAEDLVALDNEVVAIETELGENPKGSFGSVAAFLASLAGDVEDLLSALAGKQDSLGFIPENSSNKGQADGYAELDGAGLIPLSRLPSVGGSETAVDALAVGYDTGSVMLVVRGTAVYSGNGSGLGSSCQCWGGYSAVHANTYGEARLGFQLLSFVENASYPFLFFSQISRLVISALWRLKIPSSSSIHTFGLACTSGFFADSQYSVMPRAIFVYEATSKKFYACNSDSHGYNRTEINVDPTLASHKYTIDYDKVNSTIRFYVDDVLVATHTTYMSPSYNASWGVSVGVGCVDSAVSCYIGVIKYANKKP